MPGSGGKTPITPLDAWIRGRLGSEGTPEGKGNASLRERIVAHQLGMLRETVGWAKSRSAFYRSRLTEEMEEGLETLEDIRKLPFTTAADIERNHLDFLCVSQSEVERIVTLQTSATTGPAKRICFTREDQELTVDFFCHGMSTLAEAGDRVLILLPGGRPGGVSDLLVAGLERLGAVGIPHGLVNDPEETLQIMGLERVSVIAGAPVQVLSLARHGGGRAAPRAILLSADYVPDAIARELRRIWGADVYNHYGMTETGFGGGVECAAHFGCHMRELDLYFEIVDPWTGEPVRDGEAGEIVFTTLNRRGMPLIRYRTGDLSRFLDAPCPCGTVLRSMERVRGRIGNRATLGTGAVLAMADLDEALFPVAGLIDFNVVVEDGRRGALLRIEVRMMDAGGDDALREVRDMLEGLPAIGAARASGALEALLVSARRDDGPHLGGAAKRVIVDRRRSMGGPS
jgi:phenylacetate-coenzyme A ligase PaaK-like adenylate-forming protein